MPETQLEERVAALADAEAAHRALTVAIRDADHEIFCAHPSALADLPGHWLPGQLAALRRGVRVRALFQHPVRVSPVMRDALGHLGRAGGVLRTCEEIPDQLTVLDRTVAVIRTPTGGAVIREPSVVGYLYAGLEQAWTGGVPYADSDPPGYGAAGQEVKRAILRLLAAGAKDELIARRLGLSLRTCRRHISEILATLHATSRFQAGAMASQIGLLDTPGAPA